MSHFHTVNGVTTKDIRQDILEVKFIVLHDLRANTMLD